MASSARVFGNKCRALMAAAKSAAASTAATATMAAKPKAPARATGILKVQSVSPALAKFLGSPEASRSGAIKKIWEYVKSHNLQVQNSPLIHLYFLYLNIFVLLFFPIIWFFSFDLRRTVWRGLVLVQLLMY